MRLAGTDRNAHPGRVASDASVVRAVGPGERAVIPELCLAPVRDCRPSASAACWERLGAPGRKTQPQRAALWKVRCPLARVLKRPEASVLLELEQQAAQVLRGESVWGLEASKPVQAEASRVLAQSPPVPQAAVPMPLELLQAAWRSQARAEREPSQREHQLEASQQTASQGLQREREASVLPQAPPDACAQPLLPLPSLPFQPWQPLRRRPRHPPHRGCACAPSPRRPLESNWSAFSFRLRRTRAAGQ